MIDTRTQESRDKHAAAIRDLLRATGGVKWAGDTVSLNTGLIVADLSACDPEHALAAVMNAAYAQGFEAGQRARQETMRNALGIFN